MAGNARFHDKFHRKNHHTNPTVGYADSATDPIASPSEPFQGDFVINGKLSASSGIQILSAVIEHDVFCENIHVADVTYTDYISGNSTEVIISDESLNGNGNNTLTLDFQSGIFSKTPKFNINGVVSSSSALFIDSNATIKNSLFLSGNAIINGNSTVRGNESISGNAIVAGNVSIGTTSQNERLTIDKNIAFVGTDTHYIKSPNGSNNALLVFGGTTTGTNSYLIHPFYSLSSYNSAILSDNFFDKILPYQERIIVHGSEQVTGYFLISGTQTSPTAVGDNASIIGIRGYAYSGGNKFNSYGLGGNASIDIKAAGVQSLTNSGGYITFSTMPMNSGILVNNTERMRITSEGNVGIGTTSPFNNANYTSLTIDNTTSGGRIDLLKNTAQFASFYSSGLNLLDIESSGSIKINTNGANERMRISSDGKVGIGTTTPNERLTVSGSISASASLYSKDVNIKRTDSSQEGGQINFSRSSDDRASWGIDVYSDNVGSNNSRLRFIDLITSQERFTILSSGRVGIGTTNPQERLDIFGNARIDGNIITTGNLYVQGNLSALGDVSIIDTNIISTSSLSVINYGTTEGLFVNQIGNYTIAKFQQDGIDSVVIEKDTVTVTNTLTGLVYIGSPNINLLEKTSANWDTTYNTVCSTSSQWMTGGDKDFKVRNLTVNDLKITRSLYNAISTLTATGDINLEVNSPTYLFIDTNGLNLTLTLPDTRPEHIGLTFFIKNNYGGATLVSQITAKNYGGSTEVILDKKGVVPSQIELIWDGFKWQQISIA